jgi:DNA mismatch repair protein MutS
MSSQPDVRLTPMQLQYREFREKLPAGTLLLFRLGDFYEMFGDDAETGARVLGITLTKRGETPMAGIPHHAAPAYVTKLLAAGIKVAICDQAEAAVPGKLVKREISRILTPGTALDDSQLDARRNSYLLALSKTRHGFHAAWLELSTAEFRVATVADPAALLPVLHALDPREILIPDEPDAAWTRLPLVQNLLESHPVTRLAGWHFENDNGAQLVSRTLGVLNLQGFGIAPDHGGLGPAGAVLGYATDNLCRKPANLHRIEEYRAEGTLCIDPASMRNLEIFKTSGGQREGSLIAAVDGTVTSPGARLLEQWLAAPPLDLAVVLRRQDCVDTLAAHHGATARLREALRYVRDIPRILARLQNRIRNPRELGGIRDTLRRLPEIREELSLLGPAAGLASEISPCDELREHLDRALNDELPGDLVEGGALRAGFDSELDRLRGLSTDNKTWLVELERAEQAATGIRTLRVKYNGAFGYAIEVSKANHHLVPAHYIRKQTMTNAERFTTEELRQKEKEVLRSEEYALAREAELFRELVDKILTHSLALLRTANALAELDVLAGWAEISRDRDWCRPVVDESDLLDIDSGRHPVVELMLRRPGAPQAFVPNDTKLSSSGDQVVLITGPNMAGKSTYIRQVALITLLAQIGCFVPAKAARIGLVDRLFCRVGASDELARGNSTFMVEMNETANILNNATSRSLVILDEIGRGTSTYDGISIAWSVAEFLHGSGNAGPRTLFATHYHELTRLAETLPRLRNFCVAVKEWNDEILFVRRVIPGAADRSYGIQVARLAGLPQAVVDRARQILSDMESGSSAFLSSSPKSDDTTKSSGEVREEKPGADTKPEKPAKPLRKPSVIPSEDGQLALF